MFYAICLLVGCILFGLAGLAHPWLMGDGAAQLATVAATPAWRTIHWALLFGFPLMYAGLIGVTLRHHETPGSASARAGVLLAGFGFGVWALNVILMTGAGWHLARAFTAADTGMAATHSVFLYDMIHPAGLVAERLATFVLGFVAYVYGWAVVNGRVYPRWLAWAAFVVAGVCVLVAVALDENSPGIFYAQGVFVTWLAATGVVMLFERRRATSP